MKSPDERDRRRLASTASMYCVGFPYSRSAAAHLSARVLGGYLFVRCFVDAFHSPLRENEGVFTCHLHTFKLGLTHAIEKGL
jgi:hypothetical protein